MNWQPEGRCVGGPSATVECDLERVGSQDLSIGGGTRKIRKSPTRLT